MDEMELENPGEDEKNDSDFLLDSDGEQGNNLDNSNYNMIEDEADFEKELGMDDNDIDNDSDSDDEEANEAEIKLLNAKLEENPYDYSCHVALITKLQEMGEKYSDQLKSAREAMSSKYPLSSELWLSWLRDEIGSVKTSAEREAVTKLCERAVKDYLSVEVWLEYLQFAIGSLGTATDAATDVRNLFERGLTCVGLHVTKGAIIWEAFREFENVLVLMIDASNESERKEQINRVGSLFRRQLTCPLLDMEKTYEEYEVWRAGDGAQATLDDNVVLTGYERAFAKLNLRLPFEEKLISAQGEPELLDAFKAYLRFEKQHGDPARVNILYERAIAELSLEGSLWLEYITYMENNIKIQSILEPLYERATRNVPWYVVIWQKWLRAYERWDKPLTEVQALLEKGLMAGFTSAEEYRSMWLTYLEYLRRRIDLFPDDKKKLLEIIRETFNRACEYLAKAFGLEGDPGCVVLQYWARTEAIHANDMEKARTLWADILSQGHSTAAASWLEYIGLERCYGDTKHLRKLYQKALGSVKDWPESIINAWLDFERDEGTLEQLESCEAKTKEKLEMVVEERKKVQAAALPHEVTSAPAKRAGKRKPEDTGRWKNLQGSPNKQGKFEATTRPKLKESVLSVENKITPPPGYKPSKDESSTKPKLAPPPGYKSKEVEKMDEDNSRTVDERITVFVSNLDYNATEDEVRNALEPAGPITLFKMVQDFKGRSKGFCYVQLSSADSVELALKLDRTPINGRPMFVSRCDPDKTTRGSAFKYSCGLEKNKLFVKGLPLTMTKEQIEELFGAHGILKEVRLVTYRNGHSKGIAYIDFKSEVDASKALIATDGMTIEDKVISVAVSQPPERKKGSINDDVSLIKSLGGTTTSRTGSNAPKTMLSMIPRSVKPLSKNGDAGISGNVVGKESLSNADFRNLLLQNKK
ncbi:squamous cell carcinoma antigen recognized by T-cells 3-like [Neodiprion fabricii]|uniref:squamous cell carcinoma antigen recognized by T-cells 3-like n=1 Tax=Neodiprion fabricii TaxID=2872261 RepID=UPI001ED8D382|nr:squamous cell carcinoma antigen recognized by T-cells 3-like [Neodiprion fabricii]